MSEFWEARARAYTSYLARVFSAEIEPGDVHELRRDLEQGFVVYEGPGVKPYLGVSVVRKLAEALSGRCIRRDKISDWARRLNVNETNFRRFISQQIALGTAEVRGFLICFGEIPTLPIIVNNTDFLNLRYVGIRFGTVRSPDVAIMILLLVVSGKLSKQFWRIAVVNTVYSVFKTSWRGVHEREEYSLNEEYAVLVPTWAKSISELESSVNPASISMMNSLLRALLLHEDRYAFMLILRGAGYLPLTYPEWQNGERPRLLPSFEFDRYVVSLATTGVGIAQNETWFVTLQRPLRLNEPLSAGDIVRLIESVEKIDRLASLA